MKTIKIKYVDFYCGFKPDTYPLTTILREHFNVLFSDEPDYIIYSCFGHEHLKYTNCIKICCLGENVAPDFNLCDYAIAEERLDFGDRYFWYPTGLDLIIHPELYNRDSRSAADEKRTQFCSFVYSNGGADPFREQLFQAINHYRPVACGGKLHHNVDIPQVKPNNYQADRINFEKQFKFSIACENSSHPGYSTEKILISFISGTIPIYWGDPFIKEMYNEKAFINVSDFSSLDEVIREIDAIDSDPARYEEMIRQPVFAKNWDYTTYRKNYVNFLCNIFEQPKEQAYRRNRVFWGERYDHTMNEWYNAWKEKQKLLKMNFWQRLFFKY